MTKLADRFEEEGLHYATYDTPEKEPAPRSSNGVTTAFRGGRPLSYEYELFSETPAHVTKRIDVLFTEAHDLLRKARRPVV
jgi:hypothetical protein